MGQTAIQSNFSKIFILIATGILISLLILEVGMRIWLNFIAPESVRLDYSLYSYLSPDNQRYIPHHYLNYYLNPKYTNDKVYHNSLSYRNKEFPMTKPPGVFRIAVLGGSSTYDTGIKNNDETFVVQLEKILRDKYGYKNVQVINAGVGGYNSWESLINLEFRVLDLEPDLIIVYHGTNDVQARMVEPESYAGDNSGRRKQWKSPSVPILEHSALFRVLLRKSGITRQVGIGNFVTADTSYEPHDLDGHKQIELLEKNPPVYYRRNLNNMVAVSRANDAELMLSTWAYSPYFDDYASKDSYQKGFEENNEVVKEVAVSNGVPLFDFAAIMPKDKKYWSDGRHSSKLGAEKKAELFAEFIHDNGLIK